VTYPNLKVIDFGDNLHGSASESSLELKNFYQCQIGKSSAQPNIVLPSGVHGKKLTYRWRRFALSGCPSSSYCVCYWCFIYGYYDLRFDVRHTHAWAWRRPKVGLTMPWRCKFIAGMQADI